MSMLKKKSRVFRLICCLLAFLLVQNSLEHVQAQGMPFLPPGHNYFVDLSIPYSLPVLRGMRVYPDKPFEFDFMVGSGNRHTIDQKETSLLIKYFLTCLTIPEQDLWVNLSPYESGRIIPDELALTDAGNTLLEQDKFLKQLASSLTYPESRLGKKFWETVYKKAYERFGTTNLPVNTYNKVWIVPDKAIVYDMGNSALIGETHLKVMLEEDYLALKKNQRNALPTAHTIAAEITKEIILPELEKEINEGKNFAPVRQIFHSMILAAWFKRALKRNILSDVYVNRKKISGIDDVDKNSKEEIYKQYLRIYKVGAYNYIREDVDPISQQVVPRKYFSGGLFFGDLDRAMKTLLVPDPSRLIPLLERTQFADVNDAVARVDLVPMSDSAQLSQSSKSILSKFLLTMALFTPVAAGGIARAAVITPNPDGKTLHVQVNTSSDTFGGILRQAKYRGPLWGPKGAVAQVGEAVKAQIPDTHWVYLGHNYDIPKPAPSSQQATQQAVTPQAGNPINNPAAQPNQQSALPATVAPVPLHYGKKFYLYTGKLSTISIPDVSTAGIGGYIENLDENKTEYEKDELILTIKNFELESRMAATQATLELAKDTLARLEKANETQAATGNELEDARKEVQRLENQLAQDTAKEALGAVRAPNKLTIRDFQINNGASVREGSPLFSYFDGHRVRLDIYLPISAHSNDFDLTLDGKPVKSITGIDWLPTPSISTAHLSLIVTPADPIPQGQKVTVALKVYSPDKTFNKLLNTIVTHGGTSVEVGKIETYSITATADGSIKFLAREGDKVKAGQIVAQVDATPTPYQDQLQQAVGQIAIIRQQITDAQAASGTIGITEINKLRAEEFKWKAQADRLQDLIGRLDIRAPKDGVIVSSAEQRLGGAVKSGEEIFGYNTGTVFLGDINNPQNGILFPAGPVIKYGDFVLVTTKEGSRLIGVVTNVSKAFSADIQLANQSVEIKAWDQQHALRTGMFVNVSLLDQKNQDMARRVWTQENPIPSASAPPPPPPDDRIDQMAKMLNVGQNPQNVPITIVTPATSFSAQGPSVNLSEIEKRVSKYNLTAVTQRITYLQKQLAKQYPNAKSLSLDFNVYTSGGKTYYSGGILGQLPDLAVNLAGGNAYGAVSPMVFSYFAKIAALVTHEKAKQIEFAGIQTELALLEYQAAFIEKVNQAKDAGIDLGAQQQNIALLEQLISDLERARKVIADRMNVGVSTEEQLRAFDDTMAEARAAESTAKENSGKYAVALNTLTGQKELHDQVAIDLPWQAEFPTISPKQENDWINKLVDANPQIQQARAEIAAVKQKIKLQKPKGWDANAGGVYTSGAINDSITEPAFGGGEEYRASLMNPGENAANGITVPLFNGPKKIDDRIIALELKTKQAELDLKISTLKGELATSVSALRDLSNQIKEADAAYQNALQWWELKSRFTGTLYSPQDWAKERGAVNKWAMKKIDLERQYFQEQENLKKLGVLQSDESLVKDKAMTGDKAQPARSKSFRNLAWGIVAAVAFSLMPLNAQQGLSDPIREFNAWSSRAELNGNAGSLNDSNPINRMQALDFIEKYQDNRDFIAQLEKIIMNSPLDVKQELLRFMVGRKDVDLRFFIEIINKAEENQNKELAALAYQALDDVLTNNPDRSAHLSPNRDFVASSVYSEVSPEIARKVFLTWLAADPGDSTAKTHFLLGDDKDHYWSSQELAQIYNELNAYVKNHPDDPQADKIKNLAKFIRVSIKRRKALENLDATFTLGPFEQLAGGMLNFWNAASRVEIQFWKAQDLRFLNSSQWPNMEGHIALPLDAKAETMTQELIDDNPASNTSEPPLYDIFYNGQTANIYFNQLDPAGQLRYIEESGISELARILKSSIPLRKVILDRLMASRDGRLLVLGVYCESKDPQLLELIEKNYDWTGIIKEDAGTIEDPAADGIFRKALGKMYDQTHKDGPLNVLLGLYSVTELRSAQEVQDPRGDALRIAKIQEMADEGALQALEDGWDHRLVLWGGHTVLSPEELNERDKIANKFRNEDDPGRVEAYLNDEQANHGNPKGEKVLNNLRFISHRYARDIRDNDQSPALLPIYGYFQLALYSIVFGFLAILVTAKIVRVKNARSDNVDEAVGIYERDEIEIKPDVVGNGNGNGKDRAMIAISKLGTYGPTFTSLSAWRDIVNRWSGPKNYAAEDLLRDFNTTLNLAAEVIRVTPYSPDLMWSDEKQPLNETYRQSYDYFFVLACRTLDILSNRLKTANLSETQRRRFLQDTDAMLENIKYVSDYLRILKYRATIERVMNYKFADTDWREKRGFYPLARTILLYQMLWKKSRERINNELRGLLDEGNILMPGFYQDPNPIVLESKKRLEDVISEGRTAYNPQARVERLDFKKRSFNSRMLFLLAPVQFLAVLSAVLLGVPGLSIGLLAGSFIAAYVALCIFWIPHLGTLKMEKSRTMAWIMDKLKDDFNHLLDPSGKYRNESRGLSPERKIEALARQEGQEQVDIELSSQKPRVDAVVVIVENPSDVTGLQQHLEQIRGKIIRNDIPAEVVCPEFQGSGNAFLDTLRRVKRNFETGAYQQQYPNLNKTWRDTRVMYVFYGKDSPHLQNNTLIDWGIANGYRAAASLSQSSLTNGSGIIIYIQAPYYGPVQMVPGSDITLLTSRVTRDDLKGKGFVLSGFSENGDPTVQEIFEKLRLSELAEKDKREPRGSKTLKYFRDKLYDLFNGSLKQFSAFNGIILMGPEAVDIFARTAERVEKSGLREKLGRIHLTGDLLIPPLKTGNLKDPLEVDREIEGYVGERSRWLDLAEGLVNGNLKAVQDALTVLYKTIDQEMGRNPLKIKAYVPHPGAEVYKGGIDLNFQPQFIQQSSQASFSTIRDGAAAHMPDGFKGFNFNIVRFTSDLTANNAFRLMFNPN